MQRTITLNMIKGIPMSTSRNNPTGYRKLAHSGNTAVHTSLNITINKAVFRIWSPFKSTRDQPLFLVAFVLLNLKVFFSVLSLFFVMVLSGFVVLWHLNVPLVSFASFSLLLKELNRIYMYAWIYFDLKLLLSSLSTLSEFLK